MTSHRNIKKRLRESLSGVEWKTGCTFDRTIKKSLRIERGEEYFKINISIILKKKIIP
jgi:hypothetical protein